MVTYYYPLFSIMILLLGQVVVISPKPKHLKHFLFEVLVGDLVLEGERLSLEVCGGGLFRGIGRIILFWKFIFILSI